MKIDPEYLKKLLETFEGAPHPIFNIRGLQAAGLNYNDDQFVFHMGILEDQGFVERDDRKPGFGLVRGADGHMQWSSVPLRLTAQGHQFIEVIRNKEVWATLKRDFKEASVDTFFSVGKKLLEGYVKKKVEGLLNGRGST